ncbi:MAG TPA: hypothetical protein VHM91_05275 [Verrucomicrobiales bacterium]|jgi:hypothetical protein|nr:hypothetical protein [Verrucomicrobiales bacterium]
MSIHRFLRLGASLGFALTVVACEKKPETTVAAPPDNQIPAKEDDSIPPALKKKAETVITRYRADGMAWTPPMHYQNDGRIMLYFAPEMPAGEYPPPGSDRFVWVSPDTDEVEERGGL